jgi:hypothetical protein
MIDHKCIPRFHPAFTAGMTVVLLLYPISRFQIATKCIGKPDLAVKICGFWAECTTVPAVSFQLTATVRTKNGADDKTNRLN